MRSFKIYGIWPQASKHTHACAQCSPASVGLAQARPNKNHMARRGGHHRLDLDEVKSTTSSFFAVDGSAGDKGVGESSVNWTHPST